jgi:hypothetical protein
MIAVWSSDQFGRSLKHLVEHLEIIHGVFRIRESWQEEI